MTDMRVGGLAALPQKGIASASAASDRQAAWLLQLERARWQAQPRYQNAGNADLGTPGPADHEGAAHQEHLAGTNAAPAAGTEASPAPAVPQVASAEAPHWPTAALLASRVADPANSFSHTVLPIRPGAVAPSPDADAAPGVTPALPEAPAADAALPEWQQRSVHVFVGEEATTVWVRDARLQPDGVARLLKSLRSLVDRGADSHAPVRLTVNGQRVDDASRR
ncbi:MAG TPA: hypothetical protein VNU71_07615 [Burkholderiaceae bacterium]|nr:hypothetical protein [Burkholderiaceae bacterium]